MRPATSVVILALLMIIVIAFGLWLVTSDL